MHWKRWLTALVTVPLLILTIFKGGPVLFLVLVIAVSTVSLWEYFRIVFENHDPPVPSTYAALAYVTGALILIAVFRHQWLAIIGLLSLNLITCASLSIFRFKTSQDAPFVATKQLFGVVYIPLAISFAVLLHQGSDGPLWTFFLIWVVAWGDTGAFYVGSYFGRHKICPSVSPKKTVEGAVGGILANLLFGWLYKLLFFESVSLVTCLIFSIAVGIVGQIGDLFESEFKRSVGVKDSSALLPGHGGFLDRIDALLFAIPVGYLLKEFVLP